MWSRQFWKEALERAIKTGAGQLVLLVGTASLFTLDWQMVGGLTLGAILVSLATSLGSLPFGQKDSPSLV